MCVPCASDTACVAAFGAGQLCVNGSCIPGNCRMTSQCAAGQVCDANDYMCRTCASDAECVAGYGANHLCEGGACIPGQCRTSPECPNGQLCDTPNHTCGPCATHAQCVAGYGTNHLCVERRLRLGDVPLDRRLRRLADLQPDDAHVPGVQQRRRLRDGVRAATPVHRQRVRPRAMPRVVRLRGRADLRYADADLQRVRQRHRVQRRSVVRLVHRVHRGRLHPGRLPRHAAPTARPASCAASRRPTPAAAVRPTRSARPIRDYGAGHICFQGICQPGNCHGTSADCSGALTGYLCGAQSANTCGACATDSQCQADSTYGSATICNTTTGQSDERRVRQRDVQRQRSVRGQHGRLLLRRAVHARQLLRRRRLRRRSARSTGA